VALVASCMTLGCSSEASPPDLTPIEANALISQKWSHDELNRLKVSFHSDTLIECGVRNDLWKLVEIKDHAVYAWSAFQLNEKGSRIMFSIDLKESRKGHEITLKGPYSSEITGITPGSQPDTRKVEFRWEIDWSKASPELAACVAKF